MSAVEHLMGLVTSGQVSVGRKGPGTGSLLMVLFKIQFWAPFFSEVLSGFPAAAESG